jgi:hypothetical protein
MRLACLALCFVLVATTASAREPQSVNVGPCFTVHGRFSIANGTVIFRIWPVGSHRMLAVVESDGTYDEFHAPVPKRFASILAAHNRDVVIFGDYRLCPVTRSRPGWMQLVRMIGAKHLVIETW